jgi:hypothetical protein
MTEEEFNDIVNKLNENYSILLRSIRLEIKMCDYRNSSNEEKLYNDYYSWFSNIRETLSMEERKAILKRIMRAEIAKERKLIWDFKKQFE